MASLQSLEKEVLALKKENATIKRRLSSLEKPSLNLSQPAKPVVQSVAEPSTEESSSGNVGGYILIVIGALLCLTIIGAVIGIPLLFWGSSMLKKDKTPSQEDSDQEELDIDQEEEETPQKTPVKEAKKTGSGSFEENLGLKWFSRIGILALVIGVGFFVKYAIDNGWINHVTRLILGVVFGIGLIIIGEWTSKREAYRTWAKTLVGGGFAIVYFMVYAAYHFEEYRLATGITQIMDIILLSIVVVIIVFFALKDNDQTIAAEAFFLGFITSLLSNSMELLTLIYGLLLTVGLIFVVVKKQWSLIGIGGIFATYLTYYFWQNNNDGAFSSFFLITYFLAYTVQSFLLLKVDDKGKNIGMVLLNSFFFFILYYSYLDKYYPDLLGLFALILAVFYFINYYGTRELHHGLGSAHLYLGLIYLTLTVPLQLDGVWITLIWALEAVLLTMLFLKTKSTILKLSATGVGLITFIKTIIFDSFRLASYNPDAFFESTRLISYGVTIISFFFIYWQLNSLSIGSLKDMERPKKVFLSCILGQRRYCLPSSYLGNSLIIH
ncbi:MAG: DUF5362 family protein [Nanoarchaeota archaeon]